MMFLHNDKDIIVVHSKWDVRGRYDYDDLMLHTQFALIPRGNGMYSYRLAEAIAAAAIPVIVSDHYILPFSEFLNWRDFAVIIPEHQCTITERWSVATWSSRKAMSRADAVGIDPSVDRPLLFF